MKEFIGIFLLVAGTPAYACVCGSGPAEVARNAEVVFTGLLVETALSRTLARRTGENDEDPMRIAQEAVWTIEVHEVLKGEIGALATVRADISSSCRVPDTNTGERVIIAAYPSYADGDLVIGLCTHSGPVSSERGRALRNEFGDVEHSWYWQWLEEARKKLAEAGVDTLIIRGRVE